MVTATQGFSKLLVQKKKKKKGERHLLQFLFLPLASFWSIGSW